MAKATKKRVSVEPVEADSIGVVSPVVEIPVTAQFDAFWGEVSKETFQAKVKPFQLAQLKKSLGLKSGDATEYMGGWEAVKPIIEMLWKRYMGDKFKSQAVANFVFAMLLEGIETGWNTLVRYITDKFGASTTTNVADIVESVNLLVTTNAAETVIEEIKQVRDQINAPVTLPTGEVKQASIGIKLLRGLSKILRWLNPFK